MPIVFQPSAKEVVKIDSSTNKTVSQAAPTADRTQLWLRLVMVCCVYAVPVLATVHADADYDVWWHLRIGQWVVQHGAVPTNDPCSVYGQDKEWVAYSWLFEVVVYGFYQCFGLLGVVLFRLLLSLAVAATLHRFIAKREPRFLVATALTGVSTLAVGMLFKERPWLLTITFSILTLDVILDLRDGKRTWLTWLLPLLFVIWANVHIQFIYGLILLFLACSAPVFDRLLRRGEPTATAATAFAPGWWRLVLLAAACFLATLLNPYHIHLYRVVIEYATQPGPFRYLNELKSLEFREPCDWIMLVLAAAGCFALGRRKSLSAFDVLLLAFSGWVAFRSKRDMWVLILTSLYLITTAFRKPAEAGDAFTFSLPRCAAVVIGVLILTVATFFVRNLSNDGMREQVAKTFPVQAAQVVADNHYPGPLYNDFNWGGYLTWALPDLPVAIDGRTNLYGDERIEHFGDVWAGIPNAVEDEELLKAGVIIAPVNSPRASLLLRDSRFEEVHKDDLARIFVRK
jgi:hypothetical protein